MSKPTPTERKNATAELRKKHQPIFKALGIPDATYVPKMAHNVKGLIGLHMGFFVSELDGDVYTEKVSMQMESEDPDRILYKLRHNPHFKEEFAASEPMAGGDCRYFVPVDEMEIVEEPKSGKKKGKADTITIPNDPNSDLPMDQMTIRDYAAIHMKKPVSQKEWLNDIINTTK